jgi:hypothetical protein
VRTRTFYLKTTMPATESTEDTEMKRVPAIVPVHLMKEQYLCQPICFFSVNSVFSVANLFFQA